MRQITEKKAVRRFLAVAALVLMSVGCTQKWYLFIVDVTDDKPEFCLSDTPRCGDQGHQLPFFEVNEVDRQGRKVALAWSIQAKSDLAQDYIIKRLKYGVLPHGWVELHPPVLLSDRAYYTVLGQYYFRADAGHFNVYSREEFF
jgi:hypothetical protein